MAGEWMRTAAAAAMTALAFAIVLGVLVTGAP